MTTPQIPLTDFFRNAYTWGVRISPDGTKISFLRPWQDHLNIFIQKGSSGSPERVTCETRHDITYYFWKSDQYLVYAAASGYCCLNLSTRTVHPLRFRKKSPTGFFDLLEGISKDEILVELIRGGQNVSDVYRLNIGSGKMRKVATHPDPKRFGVVQRWIVNKGGHVCAAISIKGTKDYLLARESSKTQFKIVRKMDFCYSIDDIFYPSLVCTADGKGIYAISRMDPERDNAALAIASLKTGREIRCLYQDPNVDPESFTVSSARGTVDYVSVRDSKLRNELVDQLIAPILDAAVTKQQDTVVQIVARDRAEKKFILLTCGDRDPGKFYLVDTSINPFGRRLIGEVAPWLNSTELLPVSPISWKPNKRLTIHGYLTEPRGEKPKEGWPLVVKVHGGPDNRDYWEYMPWDGSEVQFLANRGYAVLQVNFRGSIGYGRSFWMEGFGEFGGKMLEDIRRGRQWAIDEKIADPNRVVIYGKSYGGYAALAAITFQPDLYKAAISYAGVSNLRTWLMGFASGDRILLPRFYIKVGHPKRDRRRLEAVAPALHASRVQAPVLIAHGALDTAARKSESDQMVAALRRADVDYIVKADEGHLFQKEKNRIDFYAAMERFLAKVL